ncbi:hypothetical protein JCM11641_006831, partial [Rhodosporidiobolus odoratus]
MISAYKAGGQFVPTVLPAKAPLVPKLKKNGRGRPVNDLRKRNALTAKMPMQPVDAESMVNSVACATYRWGNDFMKAFEQLCASLAAQKKNVVATPVGNYIVRTAMQGDANSAYTLQKLVNYVFEGMADKLKLYADDSWLFSNTWNDFKSGVLEFFARCDQWSLIVSEESMQFCPDECHILGRIIKGNKIHKEPKSVDAILNYVKPTSSKGVSKFLGAVNWHAQFVPNMAKIAAPLYDLTAAP